MLNQTRNNIQIKYQKVQGKTNHEGKVKILICGAFHNLVLFENGELWGWGSNSHGQLGRMPLGNVLRPTKIMSRVVSVVARNNHTLALQNLGDGKYPEYRFRAMDDNRFAQLGNFDRANYAEPLDIVTDYVEIATINGITWGKTFENGVPVIEAFGLYSIEERKREPNEVQDDASELKVAKLIAMPTVVQSRSFNDFIERYGSLTHYLVDASESPSLLRGIKDPPLPPLIDKAKLTSVQFLSDGQKPVAGVQSVHYGTKYNISLLSESSVGGSITIGKVSQSGAVSQIVAGSQTGSLESDKNRPVRSLLQKLLN